MPSTRRWRAGGVELLRSSPVDVPRREECIEVALANKLAERQAKRELEAKQANKEIEEFTNDFKNAARKCFQMIDKDGGGTLSTDEIVTAVKEDKDVIHFLKTCGEENLQFLLVPARLKKSLDYLDTDGSGELDVDEWEAAINRGLAKRLEQMADERARAARAAEKADAEFSADFLNAAREVFIMSARGVRPSTSNLRASRSARTPSTRLVAHRPAPAQDRQGRLRVARSRGNC